jgi:integron integrase
MEQRLDLPGNSVPASDKQKKRLIDLVREAIRSRHYSRRTEQTYWYWVRFFILFHKKRHPGDMGAAEVTAFLSWLATERNVAASTQNQALSALLFLYKQVLGKELPWLGGMTRAKRPVRLPVVLTEAEVRQLITQLHGVKWLMGSLLYGAGLRQHECLMLRIKDIDFAYRQIFVRDGKGGKDGVCRLPESVVQPLQEHLGRVRLLHQRDLKEGFGEVWLPDALSRKYPRAGYQWGWQFVFPFTASLLRHASSSGGQRHSHRAGIARTFRRIHHDDLHACHEQRCAGR